MTALQATPATWRVLLAAGWPGSAGLRAFCGGEALSSELADALTQRCGELWNLYGPTETTVWSATQRIASGGGVVPIGRPIANTTMYVVDRDLSLLPAGVPGELWIGGAGLARGYAGQPAATAERFVPDPFGQAPGGRLYRTGDSARLRPDGAFECLGRLDHQIKVRGFRVEPGEIEAALERHPRVRQAVVTADGGAGEGRLVAYVVARDGGELAAAELRALLRRSLPEYMVPSLFVSLPALPFTPNGKVDRSRLMPPAAPRAASGGCGDPLEQIVAGIWEDVLGQRPGGPKDDFFELGGHSLKLSRLAAHLRQALGVEISLSRLFEAPTVASQVAMVQEARQLGPVAPIPPRATGSEAPLSYAQEPLWFFSQLHPASPAYNMALAFTATGRLDVAALSWALAEMACREEVLRTAYVDAGGRPRALVSAAAALPVAVVDLTALPAGRRGAEAEAWTKREARRPFTVDRAPLARAALLRLDAAEYRLLVTAHHLVADGASAEIFSRRLLSFYGSALAGEAPEPAGPGARFLDFAAWQRSPARQEATAAAVAYWRESLGEEWVLNLATDRPRPTVPAYGGAVARLELSADLPLRLTALGGSRGVTPFMVLLAASWVLLSRYTGQREVVAGSPFSLRNRAELEAVLGFLVNTLPLPGRGGDGGESAADLLALAREGTLAAYRHREVAFERVMEELAGERQGLAGQPLQVTVRVQQPLPELASAGLALAGEMVATGTAKFELSLAAMFEGSRPRLEAEYRRDLWDPTTVARLLDHLASLIEAMAAAPEAPAAELPMIGVAERWQLLGEWNDTVRPPGPLPVHRRLTRWARETPDALAAAQGGDSLTYGEARLSGGPARPSPAVCRRAVRGRRRHSPGAIARPDRRCARRPQGRRRVPAARPEPAARPHRLHARRLPGAGPDHRRASPRSMAGRAVDDPEPASGGAGGWGRRRRASTIRRPWPPRRASPTSSIRPGRRAGRGGSRWRTAGWPTWWIGTLGATACGPPTAPRCLPAPASTPRSGSCGRRSARARACTSRRRTSCCRPPGCCAGSPRRG